MYPFKKIVVRKFFGLVVTNLAFSTSVHITPFNTSDTPLINIALDHLMSMPLSYIEIDNPFIHNPCDHLMITLYVCEPSNIVFYIIM